MTVLDVKGLCADADGRRILGGPDGIDLHVAAGQVLAVLGDSGAGKSTLGLGLLGESAREVELGGRVRLTGTDLLGVSERERRRVRAGRVGHLPQHPGAVLDPVRRVGSVLREMAALVHRDRRARDVAVAAALDTVRLGDTALLRRFPHQLSGGQQQRVALALTLVTAPGVIVLDEPTTGLDRGTTAELVERLRAVAAGGTALVLLTHDHDVAQELDGDAIVLEAGAVLRRGAVADVLDPVAAPPPRVREEPRGARLNVRDMRIADTSGRPVLHGVDLTAARGEVLAVVGASGAGKTTLGRCLAGLLAGRGRIEVDGRVLAATSRARKGPDRRAVQYVHQDPRATFRGHRRVLDQVARPAVLLRGVPEREAVRDAEARLARLGVDAASSSRRPGALSGGQLQRAAVARALVARPAVLVCDEVTSALDAGHSGELLAAIDALRREAGTTVVLISHDLPLVGAVADTVVTLDDGRIVEDVRPGAVVAARSAESG